MNKRPDENDEIVIESSIRTMYASITMMNDINSINVARCAIRRVILNAYTRPFNIRLNALNEAKKALNSVLKTTNELLNGSQKNNTYLIYLRDATSADISSI